MAEIRAFAGIRPREELAQRIAALPYDVYNRQEAKEEVAREPMSFLRIDRAETQLEDGTDPYAPAVYQKAHDLLWEMVENGEFVREEKPCYYLYELTMDGRSQTGLVACASIDDYKNNLIKKHENTRADKEQDRICHVDACDAQTGPIFLAYRRNPDMDQLVGEIKERQPLFSHRGWRIDRESEISRIGEIFGAIGEIYIADGHHRAASAVAVGEKRRRAYPGYSKREEFNYFLSVLFPGEELYIMDYNRVVRDLNGLSGEDFLEKVAEKFEVKEILTATSPQKKGCISMYLEDPILLKGWMSPFSRESCCLLFWESEIPRPMPGLILWAESEDCRSWREECRQTAP